MVVYSSRISHVHSHQCEDATIYWVDGGVTRLALMMKSTGWNAPCPGRSLLRVETPSATLLGEIHLNAQAAEELFQRVWIEQQFGYECSELIQGTGCAAGSGFSVAGARST